MLKHNLMLVSSLVGFVVGGCAVSAQQSAPVVSIELTVPEVYVHEAPALEITVSASADHAFTMIHPRRFYRYGCMQIQLYDPDGKPVPGGPPRIVPPGEVVPPSDQMTVPAGKSLRVPVEVLFSPRVPGIHRLSISLRLEGPKGPTIERHLPLAVAPVDEERVRQRIPLVAPQVKDRVEMLVTESPHGVFLLHSRRFADTHEQRIKRIAVLKPGTTVNATVHGIDERRGWGEIAVQLEEEHSIRLLTIGFWYGELYWPRSWLPAPMESDAIQDTGARAAATRPAASNP